MNIKFRQVKNAVIYGAFSISILMLASSCGMEPTFPDDITERSEETSSFPENTSFAAIETSEETESSEGSEPDEGAAEISETTAASEEKIVDASVYDALLKQLYDCISDPEKGSDETPGTMGVLEAADSLGAEALEGIGYALEDISGDGIPELLVGAISEKGIDCWGNEIYAAYTVSEDKPQLIFEGWYRSCYKYSGDGRFFYEGSGGAASVALGIYQLSVDGTELSCESFYVTDWIDADFTDIGVYYNTNGEWDISVSEKLDMTIEELEQLAEEMRMKYPQNIKMTPFSSMSDTADTAAENEQPVHVQWAEDAVLPDEYEEYDLSSNPISHIVFTSDSMVNGFTLLELTLTDVSDSGSMEFEAYPAALEIPCSLTDKPIVIGITFSGDIPCYGFQYEDANGNMRRFALEISGENGDIIIREANRDQFGFFIE